MVLYLLPLLNPWLIVEMYTSLRYYFGRCSSELAELVPIIHSRRLNHCSNGLHDFSVTIPTLPCLIVEWGVILQFLRFLWPIITYTRSTNLECLWKNSTPQFTFTNYIYQMGKLLKRNC